MGECVCGKLANDVLTHWMYIYTVDVYVQYPNQHTPSIDSKHDNRFCMNHIPIENKVKTFLHVGAAVVKFNAELFVGWLNF